MPASPAKQRKVRCPQCGGESLWSADNKVPPVLLRALQADRLGRLGLGVPIASPCRKVAIRCRKRRPANKPLRYYQPRIESDTVRAGSAGSF